MKEKIKDFFRSYGIYIMMAISLLSVVALFTTSAVVHQNQQTIKQAFDRYGVVVEAKEDTIKHQKIVIDSLETKLGYVLLEENNFRQAYLDEKQAHEETIRDRNDNWIPRDQLQEFRPE
jgi:hypothetical protein